LTRISLTILRDDERGIETDVGEFIVLTAVVPEVEPAVPEGLLSRAMYPKRA
jgi:hypothetical protein